MANKISNGQRKRTMVYSNVKKKADEKSALQRANRIDLDDEFFIGMENDSKKAKQNVQAKQQKQKKKNVQKNEKLKKAEAQKSHRLDKKDIAKKQQKQKKVAEQESEKIIKEHTQSKIYFQKKRAIKRMGIALLLFILIIGGIIYFMLSPIFNIKQIQVSNNKFIQAQDIINLSGILVGNNTFKFSAIEAENKIESNPYIQKAKVKRNIFEGKVQIEIEERIATIMLEYGNSFVYINNQGYILEIATQKIDSPIIKNYSTPLEDIKPGNRLSKDDLEKLENVLAIIEIANANGLENMITYIDIKDAKDYVITIESEGKTIYLGDCSDLSTRMLYIKEMLERERGFEGEFYVNMDLNEGNPVFREKV